MNTVYYSTTVFAVILYSTVITLLSSSVTHIQVPVYLSIQLGTVKEWRIGQRQDQRVRMEEGLRGGEELWGKRLGFGKT